MIARTPLPMRLRLLHINDDVDGAGDCADAVSVRVVRETSAHERMAHLRELAARVSVPAFIAGSPELQSALRAAAEALASPDPTTEQSELARQASNALDTRSDDE